MTQAPLSLASLRPDPTKIIVPRKHGQILIEPPLETLRESLNQRHEERSPAQPTRAHVHLQTPEPFSHFETLRIEARAHFLQSAIDWAAATHAPPPSADAAQKNWILTGHQVEFYHAGVWAKVFATHELAVRTNAVAFDLLVDHDVVDHLGFDVPTQQPDDGSWQRTPIQWAPPSSVPADGLRAPDRETFDNWDAALARHPQAHTDSLAFFLAALRPTSETPRAYAAWISQARAAFERSMDVPVHHVPTSLLCSGVPWLAFVRAWIDNAPAWTVLYNKHLAAYRKRQDITNPQQPMPDLARAADTCELPFWIYKIGEPRQRFTLHTRNRTISIDGADVPVDTLLSGNASFYVIRPRALALTLFVRLFVADLFIHGIGGALYDQITDALIDDLFAGSPPPVPYACVSAAWLLPLGQPLENNDDISTLKWRRHHVQHNPQLAIDPFTALRTEVAEAIRDRKLLIEQLTASLATARKDKAAKAQRRDWFRQLHALNTSLHTRSPRILANLDHQITDALRARDQNKVLLWREYFFPLHAADSLRKLIAAIHTR